MELLTPQLELVTKLTANKLPEFLATNSLVSQPYYLRAQTHIVFDVKFGVFLEEIFAKKVSIIKRYNNERQLIDDFNERLFDNNKVVFAPSIHNIRYFFNLKGFIFSMNKIKESITDAKIYLPAGIYGKNNLFFGLKHSLNN